MKNFKLEIKKPCSEKWDNMKGGNNKRFCYQCKKSVVDFTKKNEEEILIHLSTNTNVCGKFKTKQLETNYEMMFKSLDYLNISSLNNLKLYGLILSSTIILNSCSNKKTEKNLNEKISIIEQNTKKEKIEVSQKTEKVCNSIDSNELTEIMGDIEYVETGEVAFFEDDVEPYFNVDKKAEFIKGTEYLASLIEKEIDDPNIKGKVICLFTVNKKGEIKDFKIRSQFSDEINETIKKVFLKLPKWKPAEKEGKIVDSKYMQPLLFK